MVSFLANKKRFDLKTIQTFDRDGYYFKEKIKKNAFDTDVIFLRDH